jgi:GR25 family glycosyltransferase involved in LPS biosynthesis
MATPTIIYYINLAHRKDRNDSFLHEMKRIHIPGAVIERREAFLNTSDGALGCTQSHIETLEAFLKSTHQVALICEDDFEWATTQEEINSFFTKLNDIDFDVCLLAGNPWNTEQTKYTFVKKANFVTTTSAYIVQRHYIEKLLENFYKSFNSRKKGMNYIDKCSSFTIDSYWTELQKIDTWYIASPTLGKQRADYSDIEKKDVDYGC